MKKTNSLLPLAALVLLGTCLVSVFGLLVVLMTSVGIGDGLPLSYYLRLYAPILSVALPVVGMILFAAILLGLPRKPVEAVESTITEGDIFPSMNEKEKEEKQRLKAAA